MAALEQKRPEMSSAELSAAKATLGGAGAGALGAWGAGAATSELGGDALGSAAGVGPGILGGPSEAVLDKMAFPNTSGGSGSSCGCSH